jgi:hypothetical protein
MTVGKWRLSLLTGACGPDWNGLLHIGWSKSNGKICGVGGSVGKWFAYVIWLGVSNG